MTENTSADRANEEDASHSLTEEIAEDGALHVGESDGVADQEEQDASGDDKGSGQFPM